MDNFIRLIRQYIDMIVQKYKLKTAVLMQILHHRLPLWYHYHTKISIEEYNAKVDAWTLRDATY